MLPYDLPPLNCLRAFEAAGRRLSFTKAAEELHLTQAAVSFMVRKLEDQLGVELFTRLHRDLKLTSQGRILFDSVQLAFVALDDGMGAITGRKVSNVVTISAPVSLSGKWLTPRLINFSKMTTGIELRVDAEDSIVDLNAGEANLAIRYCRQPPGDLNYLLLLADTVFPVCSPVIADTAVESLAGRAGPQVLHDVMTDCNWANWFEQHELPRSLGSGGTIFSHSANAIDAALAGQGIALGRLPLVVNDLMSGRLVRPIPGEAISAHAYYLLWPKRGRLSANALAVIEWLKLEAEATKRFLVPSS